MVTTGFSKPYVAKYGTVEGAESNTYSGGMKLGRGVNVSIEPNVADGNDFYADNVVAESAAAQFTSASGTITVDGLENMAATLILGLPEPKNFEIETSKQVKMQGYGGAMAPPYVGFGYIRRTMMNGKTSFYPVIHPKVRFSIPSDSANTQEDTIDWQTQELTVTVIRDDTVDTNWKAVSESGCSTEAEAEEVIKKYLNITDEMELKTMSVQENKSKAADPQEEETE